MNTVQNNKEGAESDEDEESGLKKEDPLNAAIKKTNTDIKILNYELKRVVATEQDAFITLEPDYEN